MTTLKERRRAKGTAFLRSLSSSVDATVFLPSRDEAAGPETIVEAVDAPPSTLERDPVATLPVVLTGSALRRRIQATNFLNSLSSPAVAKYDDVPIELDTLNIAHTADQSSPTLPRPVPLPVQLPPTDTETATHRIEVNKHPVVVEERVLAWSRKERGNVPIHSILFDTRTRFVLAASSSGVPCAIFSVLPYKADESLGYEHRHKRKKRNVNVGGGREGTYELINSIDKTVEKHTVKIPITASFESLKRRRNVESYAHLLNPAIVGVYDPLSLDDPELKTGKHKTVITLPCYMASIIQYATPAELKQELNDQFRQKHPDIDPSMTLSKLRNLKASLLEVGIAEDLEMATMAKAYTYLEKLILRNYVSKTNRKLVGACCLLLALKVNDKKDVKCQPVLAAMEKELLVSPKQIRDHEFAVFAALSFSLHVPREEYNQHFERLLTFLDFYTVEEYLIGRSGIERKPQFI